MKKTIVIIFLTLNISVSATPKLDEFIQRLRSLSIDAPEKEYINFVLDLHKAGFTLPQLMIMTVKQLKDESLNYVMANIELKPEFAKSTTKPVDQANSTKIFDFLLRKHINKKKNICKKQKIHWSTSLEVSESLKELMEKTEKGLREIFGPKIRYLSEIMFVKEFIEGYPNIPAIILELDEDKDLCDYILLYPVLLIQDSNRKFALSHELIHLIRNHLVERVILGYIASASTKNKKIFLPYFRTQEIEADVYTFLLNLENPRQAAAYFKALLPWDSSFFRFFYKRGYDNLSKLIELLHMFGRYYVFNSLVRDHPTSISRMKWALRWQRLLKAEELIPEVQKTQPILPKDLNKRIRFLEASG